MASGLFVATGSAAKILSRYIYRGSNQFASFNPIRNNSTKTKCPYQEDEIDIDEKSSKENPMRVSAFGDERTIACICGDIHFMTLKKGPPVTCKCGYWFQLVDQKKFWIHKEAEDEKVEAAKDP